MSNDSPGVEWRGIVGENADLRKRAEAAEAALDRIVALREEWVRTRGGLWTTTFVMELSEALGDFSQVRGQ